MWIVVYARSGNVRYGTLRSRFEYLVDEDEVEVNILVDHFLLNLLSYKEL